MITITVKRPQVTSFQCMSEMLDVFVKLKLYKKDELRVVSQLYAGVSQ